MEPSEAKLDKNEQKALKMREVAITRELRDMKTKLIGDVRW
jgi:hypothetical protein